MRGAGTDTCTGGAGNDLAVGCEIGVVNLGSGSQDIFQYTVPTAGQGIWLDSLSSAPVGGLAVWSLSSANGLLLGNTNAANDVVIDSRSAGLHTLTVSGSPSTTTGSPRFQVHLPADAGGAITPGTSLASAPTLSVPITQPGMKAKFRVSVSAAEIGAGRVIAARLLTSPWPSDGFARFLVVDPNRSLVARCTTAATC